MATSSSRGRLDLGVVVALSWAMSAVGVTVIFGPQLGLRGWALLGTHHLFCLAGVSHEMWRGWKRRKARMESKDT